MQTLESVTLNDIPIFSFKGIKTVGKVVKIIDGDTVHIVFDDRGKLIREVCRLSGIDTPEYKKNKELAKKARNRLTQLCTDVSVNIDDMIETRDLNKILDRNHKILNIVFHGKEKYGRELVEIYDSDNICINNIMVTEGFARQYFGGKKNADVE